MNMARPTGRNVAAELIKGNIGAIDKTKKYRKEVVFDPEMKEILENEAKRNGMTVSGFIKYCVMEKLK